ncbi:hypothetical protein Slin15195_G105310 [Septoria linicola]|uniref:Uncharacterized protein n=1 Tax=Septoria linicola TaxID=215465 RepID=A0A9Q9EP19_9PEZI|nr:hypothetical protein Slin15195_G105310 [Septoria linicola]
MSARMITDAQGRCLLTELPPELQIIIFKMTFDDTFEVQARVCPGEVVKHQVITQKVPGLLLTNKQIRKQVTKMFYANATFQFEARPRIATTIKRWLGDLKKIQCHDVVSKIRLYVRIDQWHQPSQVPRIQEEADKAQEVLDSVKMAVEPRVAVKINVWVPGSVLTAGAECVWTVEPSRLVRKELRRVDKMMLEQKSRDARASALL